MADLSQFLIVFNNDRGALHHDVTVFADPSPTARGEPERALPFLQRAVGMAPQDALAAENLRICREALREEHPWSAVPHPRAYAAAPNTRR